MKLYWFNCVTAGCVIGDTAPFIIVSSWLCLQIGYIIFWFLLYKIFHNHTSISLPDLHSGYALLRLLQDIKASSQNDNTYAFEQSKLSELRQRARSACFVPVIRKTQNNRNFTLSQYVASRVREGSEKKNALTAICKGVSLVGAEGVEPPTLCL